MERNDAQIQSLIEDLIRLLRNNDELSWADIFRSVLYKLHNTRDKVEVIREIIGLYKGGMGSFSDLVLHKNKKMLVDENDKLAELKKEIFNKCLNYLNVANN
jgi:hypothetical protein